MTESLISIFHYILISKNKFYGKFRPSLHFIPKQIWKKKLPLSSFVIFVKAIAVVKAEIEKKHTQDEYNLMYEIRERIDNDTNLPSHAYFVSGTLSPCFRLKNRKLYFTLGSLLLVQ